MSVYRFALGSKAGEGNQFPFGGGEVVSGELVTEQLGFDGVIERRGEVENRAAGRGLRQFGEGLRAEGVVIGVAQVGGTLALRVADALGFSDFQAFLQGGDAVEGFGCADVGELVRDGF